MKVQIKEDSGTTFVEIHCADVTDEITRLERYIMRYSSSIQAKDQTGTLNVPVENILYIESVDKRTFIYTHKSVLMTDKRLYELEEILDKKDFFRCSKSVIIHLNKVVRLKPEITRNILATLVNGETVVVSRRYAAELKKLLGIGG